MLCYWDKWGLILDSVSFWWFLLFGEVGVCIEEFYCLFVLLYVGNVFIRLIYVVLIKCYNKCVLIDLLLNYIIDLIMFGFFWRWRIFVG